MRHTPTSLYIDTQVFKNSKLRFDSNEFKSLSDTFVKGGIRLLVPKIMERELFRHFYISAEEVANKLVESYEAYPLQLLDLNALPSLDDLKDECYGELKNQWEQFKEHFKVEELPIVGDIDEVVDWYFAYEPPFSRNKKKSKEFPDAFIINSLDHYFQKHEATIAIVSADNDFKLACNNRNYISHYYKLRDYVDAFQPELSNKDVLSESVDPTRPIVTEDLNELKSILTRANEVTLVEISRVIKLLKTRGSNYEYFFQNAEGALWLNYLRDEGYFQSPPKLEQAKEGRNIAKSWPPLLYLKKVYRESPEEVMEIISTLPDTDNHRVLYEIVDIVLESDSPESIFKFSRFIFSFIENNQFGYKLILKLLSKEYLFDKSIFDITYALLLKIVEFMADPQQSEKEALRLDDPDSFGTLLNPSPLLPEWEYKKVLEDGFAPLIKQEPYHVSRLLIDAVATMNRLSRHTSADNKNDYSDIWCPRVDMRGSKYPSYKNFLVNALNNACQEVFTNYPESIHNLDQALRNHHWMIFKRLRQHLYALNLNDQTLNLIREEIFTYPYYSKWEYKYEFQLMIHNAVDHFEGELLSETELNSIVEAVLDGPEKEPFREWMGESYSEESFLQRKKYFHRKQLRPFGKLLSGEAREYFQELDDQVETEQISDDSYSPEIDQFEVGYVSDKSPKTYPELTNFTDEQLLSYLNDWESETRSNTSKFTEITIPALANVFQSLFKEKIVVDIDRLTFWLKKLDNIERPIYIAKILNVAIELTSERDFSNLEKWMYFCRWVLSHPDSSNEFSSESSRENPAWSNARRTVVEFIDICVLKETDCSIQFRQQILSLIKQVLNQYDYRLDEDRPVILNRDDQITEAINNTRSRAIESLINYCFWVKRALPEDEVLELTEILAVRIYEGPALPLTRPEYAILGRNIGNLCNINEEWVKNNLAFLFPQQQPTWLDVFGSYISYNRPDKNTFEVLESEFIYAVDNLELFRIRDQENSKPINRLGQHLFTYFLWGVFQLKGSDSLIERYYENTDSNREYWGNLFDHIGRALKGSDNQLDKVLMERIKEFFNWRIEAGEANELRNFSFWLEAECLEEVWRLESYSKVLDFGIGDSANISIELSALNRFLDEHSDLVVECFTKITNSMSEGKQVFISENNAKPILDIGLNSDKPEVYKNAEQAKDNLLKLGHFEYMNPISSLIN